MVVVCEDRQYTIKILDKLLTDLWEEVKLLAPNVGTEKTRMMVTRRVVLADEAQQHYYLLSRAKKTVISYNLYYEIAERYSINVEKFTFAGELARS